MCYQERSVCGSLNTKNSSGKYNKRISFKENFNTFWQQNERLTIANKRFSPLFSLNNNKKKFIYTQYDISKLCNT